MLILKTVAILCIALIAVAEETTIINAPPPGPIITSDTPPKSSTPITPITSPKTTTTSTPAPTTSPTTIKPTTTTTTPKPTTTPSPAPTTPTTAKPTSPTTTTPTPTSKPTTSPTTAKPTPSPTTPKPTPTPSPTPVDPTGKWIANYTGTNSTCLLLEAALEIELFYPGVNNTKKNITIKVPPEAPSNGRCGKSDDLTENLSLNLGTSNAISFDFQKSGDKKRFDVGGIVAFLNITLPGENGTRIIVLQHNKTEFSAPLSNSYKCYKKQEFELTAVKDKQFSGVLRVDHLQVQAFRNATNTKFDNALDCLSSETPDAVPIAVGCALAALVIIVLVAYLIGRRRSQARGYLSM